MQRPRPPQTSFTAGCPVHTHGGARAPPAHSESGEECGPLSDAAPNSFEFARVFLAAGGSVPERFRRLKIPRPHAAGDTKAVACRYVQRACEHLNKLLSTHGCLDLNVVFAAVV